MFWFRTTDRKKTWAACSDKRSASGEKREGKETAEPALSPVPPVQGEKKGLLSIVTGKKKRPPPERGKTKVSSPKHTMKKKKKRRYPFPGIDVIEEGCLLCIDS